MTEILEQVIERPVPMYQHEVRAILEGRKSQFRRIVKPQSRIVLHDNGQALTDRGWLPVLDNPYGYHGDRLWVRETWADLRLPIEGAPHHLYYRADDIIEDETWRVERWRPSIHMPRWASRILLEITDVRVERLRPMTGKDAWAEGIPYSPDVNPLHEFKELWNSINAKRGFGWDTNPWVWVVEFKRVEQ